MEKEYKVEVRIAGSVDYMIYMADITEYNIEKRFLFFKKRKFVSYIDRRSAYGVLEAINTTSTKDDKITICFYRTNHAKKKLKAYYDEFIDVVKQYFKEFNINAKVKIYY